MLGNKNCPPLPKEDIDEPLIILASTLAEILDLPPSLELQKIALNEISSNIIFGDRFLYSVGIAENGVSLFYYIFQLGKGQRESGRASSSSSSSSCPFLSTASAPLQSRGEFLCVTPPF